ncbi:MAG: EF-P lysine aminoacylase GenX [Desulfobacterales bacterium]|nr:EF-P lysine aminoacylase GenX [Desulfobacterales bacterium]
MSPGSRNRFPLDEQKRPASRKQHLWLRARLIQSVRQFFIEQGYLEVETPQLIPAPAPEVHIDAMGMGDKYLHTSPELCMKRLLAAGYPRIFQIGKCFREGERGNLHLPEFTLLEWYRAGIDYKALMEECEELILFVCKALGMGELIEYQGAVIDIKRPWDRILLSSAFECYASLSLEKALNQGRFDEVMVRELEPYLGRARPAFLYDYPASMAALARLRPDSSRFAERFEIYVAGLELANGFSELTDPREQRDRFEKERKKRYDLGKKVYPMPGKFLKALEHMPKAAGIALGLDRLVMIFADSPNIDHVVAFTPEEV